MQLLTISRVSYKYLKQFFYTRDVRMDCDWYATGQLPSYQERLPTNYLVYISIYQSNKFYFLTTVWIEVCSACSLIYIEVVHITIAENFLLLLGLSLLCVLLWNARYYCTVAFATTTITSAKYVYVTNTIWFDLMFAVLLSRSSMQTFAQSWTNFSPWHILCLPLALR